MPNIIFLMNFLFLFFLFLYYCFLFCSLFNNCLFFLLLFLPFFSSVRGAGTTNLSVPFQMPFFSLIFFIYYLLPFWFLIKGNRKKALFFGPLRGEGGKAGPLRKKIFLYLLPLFLPGHKKKKLFSHKAIFNEPRGENEKKYGLNMLR